MKIRKGFLVVTDLGLATYWALTALGIISVGNGDWINAWNWSFFPLDLFAIVAGLTWSVLPREHRWTTSMYATALAFTHAAGLMAISFFILYGTWDVSWWLVNLWLVLMPIGLAIVSMKKRPAHLVSRQAPGLPPMDRRTSTR